MSDEENTFQEQLERIETLIQQISTSGDPAVRTSAQELVQLLLDLHAKGLERMMDTVWETAEDNERIIHEELPDDDLVSSLLILHGLHPLGLEVRVEQALEEVRPYMHSHGGGVELVDIREGVVRLQLEGSCDGCQASNITLKHAVEDAIYEAAPEVEDVEVVGMPDEEEDDGVDDSFIPLEQVSAGGQAGNGMATSSSGGRESEPEAAEWRRVTGLADLGEGSVQTMRVAGHAVLFFRREDTLYAYASECPSCHQSLRDARVEGDTLTCPHCDQAFDGVQAGRGMADGDLQLDPVPLLGEEDQTKVALPEAVT